ncbi:unnamed protein product [Prunus brigantina]
MRENFPIFDDNDNAEIVVLGFCIVFLNGAITSIRGP